MSLALAISARPDIGARPQLPMSNVYRPSIDVERVRLTWMRTERLFQALKRHDGADALASYGPAAICESDLLGELNAAGIERAVTRLLALTPDLRLSFQIEHAGIDESLVRWSAKGTLHVTGRPISISGVTELSFGEQGVFLQVDQVNMRAFTRQALGRKAWLFCLIPGWRRFVVGEMRKSLQLDEAAS